MKKAITYRLCLVIIVSMLAAAALSYYLQVKSVKDSLRANSLIRIDQISQILQRNDEDLEQLKEDLQEDYFIRAKAAAYIVQNYPTVIGDQAEMKKIASLLQVDELHLFDTEGKIYTGSEPKYFNYTFNSGEQMRFFLPMLQDTSLQLCQEVTPNTAEGKQMQYLAVWREDKQGIVQIGMEPIRLIEAMEKNELSHIFTMVTAEKGITIFAVNPETGVILGATDDTMTGKELTDFGLDLAEVRQSEEGFTTELAHKKNYCVFQEKGNVLIGVSSTYEKLYQGVPDNMRLVIFSLFLLSVAIIFLLMGMMDRIVIDGMYELIASMKKISGGDLDARVEVSSSPEFVELSTSINNMVLSLLETTKKLSLVFENVNIPIAVYEYNGDMKRVLATSKIGDMLMLSEEEVQRLLSDQEAFVEKIQQVCACPLEQEKDVYRLCGDRTHYLKIKSYEGESGTLGILVDVTEENVEKQQIMFERDIDHLTGLSSRRAFYDEMDQIFQRLEELETAVLLMIDLDNLKQVNDNWGHEYGDKLLQKAGELLKNCEAPNKVVARLGGDEFVMLIYRADSQEEIEGYLEQLHNQILNSNIQIPNQEPIQVSMSGGYVLSTEFTEDYNTVLRLADQTMYQVKKENKGHFARYQEPDHDDIMI